MRQFAAAGSRTAAAVSLQEQSDLTAVDPGSRARQNGAWKGRWLYSVMSYRKIGSDLGVVEPEVHKLGGRGVL